MKITRFAFLAVPLLATFIYLGCQKTDTPDTSYQPQYVTAGISGRILDENKLPVSGATVKAGSMSVTTNASGQFTISNISVDKNAGMVKVEKDGYFTGIKTIVVTANKENYVSLQLIKKTTAGSFSGSGGGSITVPSGGGTVVFPAGSIVNATTNTAYTGTVAVSAFFINPEASDFREIMPGTLRGLTTANQETGLQSFGMMAVELNGSGGEKLQLASGKTATINFPIAASLQAQAPATIPLWSLNEATGLWKEEGTATRQGNNYVGAVGHFSYWNCDAPFAVVDFTATIKTQQSVALAEAKVIISGADTSLSGFGYTNSEGVVSGKVPANRNLVLKVYDKCGNLIHTQNTGPFTTATNLGVITVTSSVATVTLSGTVVNCNAAAVTNGYVTINLEGVYYRSNLVNGVFSIPVTRCSNAATSATVVPYDIGGTQAGPATTVAITGTTVNTGQLVACGTTITQYINYNINGTNYSFSEADSLFGYRIPQSQFTVVSGIAVNRTIDLSFPGEPVAGPSPLQYLFIGHSGTAYTKSGNITVNVTEYANITGGFIAGNFTGSVKDTITSAILPINLTFRVKKSN